MFPSDRIDSKGLRLKNHVSLVQFAISTDRSTQSMKCCETLGGDNLARTLKDTKSELALAEKLRAVSDVSRYNGPNHDEATLLAHAFADIEASAEAFSNSLSTLAQLERDDTDQLRAALLNIGECFRQMLKQMRASEFYRYLPTEKEMLDEL